MMPQATGAFTSPPEVAVSTSFPRTLTGIVIVAYDYSEDQARQVRGDHRRTVNPADLNERNLNRGGIHV